MRHIIWVRLGRGYPAKVGFEKEHRHVFFGGSPKTTHTHISTHEETNQMARQSLIRDKLDVGPDWPIY